VFTVDEWIAILESWANGQGMVVSGLVSKKTGNPYSGRLFFDSAANRVGIEFT